MKSLEERLKNVEKEIEELKKQQSGSFGSEWLLRRNEKFKNDADFKEIFRLGKELRDQERRVENA